MPLSLTAFTSAPLLPLRRASPLTSFSPRAALATPPTPRPPRRVAAAPKPPSSPAARPVEPPLHPALIRLNHATVSTCVAVVDRLYASPADAFRRFYVLEVMARVPFFAWTCLLHLKETMRGPTDFATERLREHFEQSDNEALHLAVMCEMGGGSRWLDQFLSAHLAMVYFFTSILVFVVSPAVAFHFGDCVERHAFETYDQFLRENEEALRTEFEVPLVAHEYYENSQPPRAVRTMYDVIGHIRDDESHHSRTLGDYAVEACCDQLM